MIPNLIHFVYVGGRPFGYIHYLAMLTAWTVHRPERLYLHCSTLPAGPWWERIRERVTVNPVPEVREVFGNAVVYPAHQADVIRLEQLQRLGGIYLDLDVVSIRSLDPLRNHDFVMGMEAGTGLCNAVIMARNDSAFLARWWASYRDFDHRCWNRHSVVLPWQLAQQHPEDIQVVDPYAFFYPGHADPVHGYLWGEPPTLPERGVRVGKNLLKLAWHRLPGKRDPIKEAYYRCFHALRGGQWHYQRARKSYCIHLWEGLWGRPYLDRVTPDYIASADTHFARLIRGALHGSDQMLGCEPASFSMR